MLRLSIADHPAFAIDLVDLERTGPSYTADTLERLHAEHPDTRFVFIMGADSLMELHTWHEPARILARAEIAVARRSGVTIDCELARSRVPELRGRLHLVDIPMIGISSSDLRNRVRTGHPIAFQVPAAVEKHIRDRRLYLPG
jgi:nicotinate-nucleotide adenylyltransferase